MFDNKGIIKKWLKAVLIFNALPQLNLLSLRVVKDIENNDYHLVNGFVIDDIVVPIKEDTCLDFSEANLPAWLDREAVERLYDLVKWEFISSNLFAIGQTTLPIITREKIEQFANDFNDSLRISLK